MKPASWRWVRPAAGALILAALVLRLGTDAFVDAMRAVDATALALGAAIALVTTTAGAWRWRVVARQLHVELAMPAAVVACYRAQFLNVTLPGGVLGDIDRGVHHGRSVDDLGRGLRAVAWERTLGQVALVVVTVGALVVANPVGLTALVAAVVGVVVGAVVLMGLTRVSRVVAADVRALSSRSALAKVFVASLVVMAGHVATLAIAARTVGVRMPASTFVPVALVVLLVAAVPLNLAGWGPREAAAVWAFGAAGAKASQGLAVAVAFGVIVFVSTLPGVALLSVGRRTSPNLASADAVARGAIRADARLGGGT
ncbi:lysylphosphatidylglycerol synthase domain-containing protein [Knoellia sp. S7-12]|uniref:lysylphosphatidylglycerol synthase domain-containing protein n=1 Tax=Knoellia sp. S7-12 TaxID=3126698 RepID=UPI0033693009